MTIIEPTTPPMRQRADSSSASETIDSATPTQPVRPFSSRRSSVCYIVDVPSLQEAIADNPELILNRIRQMKADMGDLRQERDELRQERTRLRGELNGLRQTHRELSENYETAQNISEVCSR